MNLVCLPINRSRNAFPSSKALCASSCVHCAHNEIKHQHKSRSKSSSLNVTAQHCARCCLSLCATSCPWKHVFDARAFCRNWANTAVDTKPVGALQLLLFSQTMMGFKSYIHVYVFFPCVFLYLQLASQSWYSSWWVRRTSAASSAMTNHWCIHSTSRRWEIGCCMSAVCCCPSHWYVIFMYGILFQKGLPSRWSDGALLCSYV